MPILKLTQDTLTHHLTCPAPKSRIELCDTELPGLYIEVRLTKTDASASSTLRGIYFGG